MCIKLGGLIRQLKANIRVITVSGDKKPQAFENKLSYHYWQDNYCDFSGMRGVNFKNYAVLGALTLFLLNIEGMVLKKTAMVDELMKIIDKKNPVDPS